MLPKLLVRMGGQHLGLAEAGICCTPVVVVGSMLGCSIIVPAGGWVFGGLLPTCNGHGFFPKCSDYSYMEELEAGGDVDVDGGGGFVVIRGFWS